jgi:hypothetical protein
MTQVLAPLQQCCVAKWCPQLATVEVPHFTKEETE